MKKKVILFWILMIIICLTFTGCKMNKLVEKNKRNLDEYIPDDLGKTSSNESETNDDKKDTNKKIYKYMKMSCANGNGLLYSADYIFDNSSEVSSGDTYYKPCIIAEFNTKTGKATSAKFYTFFLDYSDDEWVNKAMEKYDSSSSESKKNFTNIQKGRVNDNVSYLSADVNVDSYSFTQYIDMLIKNQDIEKYKDEIFFSRLYNYDSEPPHEEGENFFEESLEGIRIEWSNEEIKAF